MAKVTIEFDTDIPEQYSSVVEALELLGERPTLPSFVPVPPVPPSLAECVNGVPVPFGATPQHQAVGLTPSEGNRVPPSLIPPVPEPEPDIPVLGVAEPGPQPLDTEGIPWDARIHTERRTKRQNDMTWKLKRGVSDATVQQVKSELRGLTSSTPSAPTAAPAVTKPPVMPGQSKYQTLMQAVSKAIPTGRLTMTDVETACVNAGIATPQDLANQPDLIPQVAAELGVALC